MKKINMNIVLAVLAIAYGLFKFVINPSMRTVILVFFFGCALLMGKILIHVIKSNWAEYGTSRKIFAVGVLCICTLMTFVIEDLMIPLGLSTSVSEVTSNSLVWKIISLLS